MGRDAKHPATSQEVNWEDVPEVFRIDVGGQEVYLIGSVRTATVTTANPGFIAWAAAPR